MALTDFEKKMISKVHDAIQRRRRKRQATDQDEADFETIIGGTEAERQTIITNYINNIGIPTCNDQIAACDAAKAEQQTLLAEMQNYVA